MDKIITTFKELEIACNRLKKPIYEISQDNEARLAEITVADF